MDFTFYNSVESHLNIRVFIFLETFHGAWDMISETSKIVQCRVAGCSMQRAVAHDWFAKQVSAFEKIPESSIICQNFTIF